MQLIYLYVHRYVASYDYKLELMASTSGMGAPKRNWMVLYKWYKFCGCMNAAIITIDYYTNIRCSGIQVPWKILKEKLLSSHPLLTVKQNGLVVELVRLCNARRLPWKLAVLWLKQLCGRNWPTNSLLSLNLSQFIESIVIWY